VELGGPQAQTFRETLKQIETHLENKN